MYRMCRTVLAAAVEQELNSLALFVDGEKVPMHTAARPSQVLAIHTDALVIGRGSHASGVELALHDFRVWKCALDASVLSRSVVSPGV